jgi:hypothetical protein
MTCLWIFDDIHWSAEMEEPGILYKSIQSYTVTVDTISKGLVFFRHELQPKEAFCDSGVTYNPKYYLIFKM